MRRLYLAGALALAGTLVAGCRDDRASAPTAPELERVGRIKIDGVIAPNEWRDAAVLPFMANAPEALVPAELLAQRDDRNLYLAIRIRRPASGLDGGAEFEFDSDNDGQPFEALDDIIAAGGVPPTNNFGDVFRDTDGTNGSSSDDTDGGTADGAGAVLSDGATTVYEFRHPLNSGDLHDFALSKLRPQVGFEMRLYISIPGGTNSSASGEGTHTQVASYGTYCKLTAFPAVSLGGCAANDVAMVRVTPRQSTTAISLISMPTHATFIEPLGLFIYDYLGNAVAASCTWQTDNPAVVQVDQQGHISSGAATGSAAVGANCVNRAGLPVLGSVRVDVN